MFLLARNGALAVISLLVTAVLYGADKPISVALILDGLTHEDREPLRDYLTKAIGRPVKLVTPDTYSKTAAGLEDGSFDFACLGALTYIRARAKLGVIPLVQRTSDLRMHTVLITGAASSIHSLGDLNGKRFAFGDVNSTGTLMVERELMQAGINPESDLQIRYSGSHPATAALVETGVVDAGAIDETVFTALISEGKLNSEKVRVFYTTKPFVSYLYVSRKDVPEGDREKFARALLTLKEGKDDTVLKILRAKHFVVATDEEYANIRQIARKLGMF
jgi:phosphonate transport system substrate-binding protein